MKQRRLLKDGDALDGQVRLDIRKTFITLTCFIVGIGGAVIYGDWSSLVVLALIAYGSMFIGVVAYHRLLIHRSFKCSKRLEYSLVFVANFSGMGSPIDLVKFHELRDWAQRKDSCHDFFAHRHSLIKDGLEQLFCRIELAKPPEFKIESSRFYQHMHRYWWSYQIPLGVVLYLVGGWSWVCGGVFLKMFAVQFGHWFVAYYLHNSGEQPEIIKGAGVQGYNIALLALFTFGESYHNNHHLCPEAAQVGFRAGQLDPAWWLIRGLEKLDLVRGVVHYQKSSNEH